ncbi:MAG TPA: TetR/AcrR family transcriptional regulator [Jatrophihabitantaceae bacterium]
MARKLTAKGERTRSRIIAGAADEIREYGLGVTTLDDILFRTRTSKGQLFHYFPRGKEELLLAVAQHEAQRVLDDQQPYLGQLTSWRAWQAWRDAVVERYRQQGPTCPLAVLMTELGRSTPAARAVTGQLIDQWEQHIFEGIKSMQGSGRIPDAVDARQAARALLAGVQGGVSILLSTGDVSHLEAALDTGIAALRT